MFGVVQLRYVDRHPTSFYKGGEGRVNGGKENKRHPSANTHPSPVIDQDENDVWLR